jgi:cell division septation protein DedD
MTREDEYTLTLSSGKIVTLISVMLCTMLACFVTGLAIGRSPQIGASAPVVSTPEPELSRAEQATPKVTLPEIPKPAPPPEATTPPPAKEEPKPIAEKTVSKPAPQPTQVPAAPASTSASASTQAFSICVLSAKNKAGADSYAARLRRDGYKASVQRTESQAGAVWYRTVIGEFPSKDAAERQLAELRKKTKFSDAFIIAK